MKVINSLDKKQMEKQINTYCYLAKKEPNRFKIKMEGSCVTVQQNYPTFYYPENFVDCIIFDIKNKTTSVLDEFDRKDILNNKKVLLTLSLFVIILLVV